MWPGRIRNFFDADLKNHVGEARPGRNWIVFEQLLQDLRNAWRMLQRNPGFSATAVLTLALGIGMNTAMFSVVDAVILQPLPYPNPERLVWISDDCSANGYQSWDDCLMSRGDFVAWKQQAQSFQQMALMGNEDITLVANGSATTERVGSIQGDFWAITNAQPVLGHLFGAHQPDSVVLTWPLFERTFGGNPSVIGKTVELEGHPFTVTGVLSPKFRNVIPQTVPTHDLLPAGETVRNALSGIDKNVPVFQVQTLAQELSNSVAARRFNLSLLMIFAVTAVLLAVIGIYGVIAYLVAQRTAEIGIRMALGAPSNSILQMIVRQGMTMVLVGIGFGLAIAAALTRFMANMLYGVKAGDTTIFALVAAVIGLAALLACVGPALRAAWIDPMIALRNE